MLNVIHRLIEPTSTHNENREKQLNETIQIMIKNAHSIKEILDCIWPIGWGILKLVNAFIAGRYFSIRFMIMLERNKDE